MVEARNYSLEDFFRVLSQCRHFHYIIVSIFNAAVPEALERTQSFKFFAVFTSKK